MANEFVKIDPHKLKDNIFKLIDLDWMLVTAGPRRGPTSGSSAIGVRPSAFLPASGIAY